MGTPEEKTVGEAIADMMLESQAAAERRIWLEAARMAEKLIENVQSAEISREDTVKLLHERPEKLIKKGAEMFAESIIRRLRAAADSSK